MKLNSKAISQIRKMMNVTGMIPLTKIFTYVKENNIKVDAEGNLIN